VNNVASVKILDSLRCLCELIVMMSVESDNWATNILANVRGLMSGFFMRYLGNSKPDEQFCFSVAYIL
jgi:hypothetical protein